MKLLVGFPYRRRSAFNAFSGIFKLRTAVVVNHKFPFEIESVTFSGSNRASEMI